MMRKPLDSLLHDGLGKVPDVLGGLVMDHDGLVVAESALERHSVEWQNLVTELTQSVRRVVRPSTVTGALEQLVVMHQGMTTLISPLAANMFLAVALDPNAIIGRTQFWMKDLLVQLDKELLAA